MAVMVATYAQSHALGARTGAGPDPGRLRGAAVAETGGLVVV